VPSVIFLLLLLLLVVVVVVVAAAAVVVVARLFRVTLGRCRNTSGTLGHTDS
jgi:hypothetical protein